MPLTLAFPNCPLLLAAGGLVLVGAGLLYRLPGAARWDTRAFLFLYASLLPATAIYRLLWHLGRTFTALLLLAATFLAGWRTGCVTLLVYFSAVGLERAIKLRCRRPRPFESLETVRMDQPHQPRDPSFPSGDALRVWFLALVAPAVWGLPVLPALTMCLLAALVSLGRVALGVHYPLDVLAGTGLGLLAAGLALAAFQIFGLVGSPLLC